MQKLKSCKGDWVLAVEEDKVKFGITESDFEITAMSKEKFKATIREKIDYHVVQSLNNIAENHSKSEKLINYEFKRKAYLTDRRFTKEDVQILFSLRTKMFDCKTNFQNQYKDDLTCRVCKAITSVENEDHLLLCEELNNKKYDVQFSDVFGNTDQQYNAVIAFKQVLRRRKVYFDIFNNSSS